MSDTNYVGMDIDLTPDQYEMMLNHADRNMSVKQLNDLKVEWAVINLITLDVEEKSDETD
jgi:hypothetical protein